MAAVASLHVMQVAPAGFLQRQKPQQIHAAITMPSRSLATQQRQQRTARRAARRAVVVAASASPNFADFNTAPQLAPEATPDREGVYAVYDPAGNLQFVGLSRRIKVSVGAHAEALPELVGSVKVLEVPGGSKDELTEAWKAWIQQAVEASGGVVPPGNAPGETKWQQRRRPPVKPEIRLTPGKGIEDLTVGVEVLVDQVVKTCKVVAFIKGSRTSPQCGFSYKVLTILQELGADYEVVNVLDEVYNPGVREAIKTYTQWPTIPQVFVQGEFIGGADIVEQMHGSGELRALLAVAGAIRK